MRRFTRVSLIAIATSCITASSFSAHGSSSLYQYYKQFRTHATIPKHWIKEHPAPPNEFLHLQIGLRQQNVDAFHQKVLDISTPDHPSYGMHMSQTEIDGMLKPAEESAQLVLDWLRSNDIQGVLDNHWVKANVTVSQANKLLQTRYNTYRNKESGSKIIRTTAYRLPTILVNHVDFISPTTMFPMAFRAQVVADKAALRKREVDPSCTSTITIKCLQQLYRIPQPLGSQGKITPRIGVAGFLEQYANHQDFHSFLAEQQPAFVGKTFTAVLIKGGLNSQNLSEAGAEANLDIQFTQGLAPTHDIVYYSVAGRPNFIPSLQTPTNTNEPFDYLLDYLLSHPNPPHTLSISYGSEEQTVPREYAQRVCNGFAQLGARGVSVIVPSGDGGVGDGDRDPATQHCFTNDGRNITRFQPVFPATCPFVTSVGATAGINPEVAVSRFFSGGGFSWYFPQATYQAALVDAYLDKLPKGLYKGLYNAKGRAYPDVSAQGENYRIWLSGRPMKIGGTSASTPTFAAVISRLNERRFSQGKKPLGFLNPWLYGGGKGALNDILSGHNSGCGTEGFSAAPGWDPVTGLGTPDFVKMLAALPP